MCMCSRGHDGTMGVVAVMLTELHWIILVICYYYNTKQIKADKIILLVLLT